MNPTATRSREGLRDRLTSQLEAGARAAYPPVIPQARALLVRYLLVAFALVAVTALVSPAGDGSVAPSEPWDYQRETIDIDGGGVLNAYARVLVGGTAWLARTSIERQRDVYRMNLLDTLVGSSAADGIGRWRAGHGLGLQVATELLLIGLIAYGVLRRPGSRSWILAALLVLTTTVLVTKPQATMRGAAAPSLAVPAAMLPVAVYVTPGEDLEAGGLSDGRRVLVERYWRSFVAHPLSRVQTGGAVLADEPPAGKPGVLESLRDHVGRVNDWALGRHGLERAFIATSAFVYVLPAAVVLAALAMLAVVAQALLFLLCLGALVALPLAVEGRRRRGLVVRYWLLPLLACMGLLAAVTFASFVVLRVSQALHASDEYIGLLLAGSLWPVVAAVLLGRRVVRRRAATRSERS